jgi:tetratricopeptide (TPR) repeat protein
MNNLANAYYYEGKYAQAEVLQSQAVEMKRRVKGPEHPSTLYSMNNLALVYRLQGKYEQAEALHSQTLEIQRRVLGPEHPDTLFSMGNLADAYQQHGKYAQAEALQSQVVEMMRRVLGPEHPATLISMNGLADAFQQERKYAQAETVLREAWTTHQKISINTWDRYNCESMLGASLAGQKKYAEAEPLLLSGYEGMLQRESTIPAESHFNLERARQRIIQLYQDWGKPDKAAEWRNKVRANDSPVSTSQR